MKYLKIIFLLVNYTIINPMEMTAKKAAVSVVYDRTVTYDMIAQQSLIDQKINRLFVNNDYLADQITHIDEKHNVLTEKITVLEEGNSNLLFLSQKTQNDMGIISRDQEILHKNLASLCEIMKDNLSMMQLNFAKKEEAAEKKLQAFSEQMQLKLANKEEEIENRLQILSRQTILYGIVIGVTASTFVNIVLNKCMSYLEL